MRVVGAGHSYNDVAIVPETQVSLRNLNRVLHVDAASGRLTVQGGTALHEIHAEMAEHGLAFADMGDIVRQSIVGACPPAPTAPAWPPRRSPRRSSRWS